MKHRTIIENLKSLNLATASVDLITEQLKELGQFGIIVSTLHPGKKIIRARLSEEKPFDSISLLSYKPQKYNETFQRASTPNKTMFYGSIVPEIKGESEPSTARATVLYEISDFARDRESIGIQKIVYSAWEVLEDIELVSILHHKKFAKPTQLSLKLQEDFKQFAVVNPALEISTLEISEFLASEFAKYVIEDYEYKISAIYSELTSEKYDGVMYPSVQLEGEGINVAIKPHSVETKLICTDALECTLTKNRLKATLSNDLKAKFLDNGSITFSKLSI